MKRKLLALSGMMAILVASFVFLPRHEHFAPTGKVGINGKYVAVEIADTPEKQERGLSGKRGLEDGQGMLFIFNKPAKYAFWMKDMNFAIDIIWIGEDLKVVGIEKSVPPETYPESFLPEVEARYVLEVPAGFADKVELAVGQIVSIGQENL